MSSFWTSGRGQCAKGGRDDFLNWRDMNTLLFWTSLALLASPALVKQFHSGISPHHHHFATWTTLLIVSTIIIIQSGASLSGANQTNLTLTCLTTDNRIIVNR